VHTVRDNDRSVLRKVADSLKDGSGPRLLTDSILQKDDRRIAIELIVLMDSGDEDGCKG
jgi:hypothetical protein